MFRNLFMTISLFTAAIPSHAATLGETCSSIFSDSKKAKCLAAAGQFQYFDRDALRYLEEGRNRKAYNDLLDLYRRL